jgi:thiamine biosynthesis lipoprotein
VEHAVEMAIAAVERVDQLMSFHVQSSELCQLNRLASREPQTVDPWTYAVLRRAQRIAELSDGIFDISVAPLLVEEGLLPNPEKLFAQSGRWRSLRLLPQRQVFFAQPMLLDLGGIAKGFAIDQAIHALHREGCVEAMVNAGGDLRRFGMETEVIHLRRSSGLVPMAELRNGAMATSSPRESYPERLAQPIGCIIDPKRRQPWRGPGSVTVAARSCMIADALTKVAALAGPSCEPLLALFGAQARWEFVEA